MQDHIFRMYDIRGIVHEELFIDQVYDCARATALFMKTIDSSVATVAVGMDGRVHSLAIKEEWIRGLRDSGLSVIDLGICPTPLVSFSEYWLSVDAACMITASHNPKEYNGIKLFLRKQPLFREGLQEILQLFKQKKHLEAECRGSYHEYSLIPDYIGFLKEQFPHLVGLEEALVFDTGNGAVGAVLPALCEAFSWNNSDILYAEVDGTYPNHEADPSVHETMQDLAIAVVKRRAMVGIAFDGDGDRMGAVTETGTMINGDQLLALFAQDALRSKKGLRFVCDAKCSTALKEVIEQEGGALTLSPSGHAFLRSAMEREGAVIAGELSCHFFFKDRYFGYDDGIYAALRLIELLIQQKESIGQLLLRLPQRISSAEKRIHCQQGEGPVIVKAVLEAVSGLPGVTLSTIDGVRIETEKGWGLLRASNTQPVICLRYESDSEEGLQEIEKFFVHLLEHWYDRATLQNYLQR